MIELSVKSFKLTFTFGFFFILGITSLNDDRLGLMSLLFCTAHELGHFAAITFFGASVREIRFYGAGIKMSSCGSELLSKPKRAAIYLGGPAVNFVFALLLRGDLSAVNLWLGVFNLLPIKYFDGGKLLALAIKEDGKVMKAISLAATALLGAAVAYSAVFIPRELSPSSVITFIFIVLSGIFDV